MKALYHNTRGPSSSCCQPSALIQAILPCPFLTPGPGTWFHPANLLTSLLQCSTTSLLTFFFSFFWQLPHLFLIKFQSSSCLHSLHPSHGLLFSYAFMGVVCGEKHKSPLSALVLSSITPLLMWKSIEVQVSLMETSITVGLSRHQKVEMPFWWRVVIYTF